MQERFKRPLGYFLALIFYAGAMFAVAIDARAHGDAQWISDNDSYIDVNGRHCCGPSDCNRAPAAKFREAPEGIWVVHGAGEILMDRRLVGRGLYPSINDEWWVCLQAGVVRCVFKPTTEG